MKLTWLALLGVVVACDEGEDRPAVVDCETFVGTGTFYEDNPTFADPRDDEADWIVATPAEVGLDAEALERAAATLADDPAANSFLVIRHDKLVFERYFHGTPRDSNNVHSASKTLLAMAIGIAIDRGEMVGLEQPIAALLPGHFESVDDAAKREITVRHLLTMTGGLSWSEDETESTIEAADDWVLAILERPLVASPGEGFEYSTGSTHVLSAALTRATGVSTCAYVHEHVLAPLGITAERWGRDPQGYFSGGFNVYLTSRELAKLGLLVLHRGKHGAAQLVPDPWMSALASTQVDAGDGYGYGLGVWTTTLAGHPVTKLWGYGGQLAFVVSDLDLVVVMTTNTADFTPDLDGDDLVSQHILASAASGSRAR